MSNNLQQYLDSLDLENLLDFYSNSVLQEYSGRESRFQDEVFKPEDIKQYILDNFDN